VIEFYTYRPDRLNLNGDQANVAVLRKRLEWAGIESRVVAVEQLNKLEELDAVGKFLMLGHGSAAAMRSFASEAQQVREQVLSLADRGWVGLAVGSGYELLFPGATRRERLSDYADVEATESLPRLFGYVNTDAELPLAQVLGEAFVCTMVHGPVLARTPELADALLRKLGVASATTKESEEADSYARGANEH